IAYKPE
uniref:Oviductal motility-stimulating peptide n=1 Tax=Leptinotarsa decemlineata TaxID=7539 RepID=OVM_LEPDE|nr:RecName: Full=Oviductal motility-stimulating peptide; AltName: Full=LeD-OVM [Leptinotarsa decemlineata]